MTQKQPFIAYYRVSTEDQGKSGLGLSAQKASVLEYINSNGLLLGEFQDVQTGKDDSREGFDKALELAKKEGAILVVKEISRISRGGLGMMYDLQKSKIHYIESTAPHDPKFMKGLKFLMAEEEVSKLSERTSAALSEIKAKIARGEKHISKAGNVVESLGNPDNLTDEARERSAEVRKEMAYYQSDNRKAGAFIVALKESGASFYAITNKLNEAGFKTSRGNEFSQVQVKRLFERYGNSN